MSTHIVLRDVLTHYYRRFSRPFLSLSTLAEPEVPGVLERLACHELPGEAWRTDPERRFDVYIEAQLWSDEPVKEWLGATPETQP